MSVGFRASNVTSYNGGYLRTDKLHNDNGVTPQPTFQEKIYLAINEKRYDLSAVTLNTRNYSSLVSTYLTCFREGYTQLGVVTTIFKPQIGQGLIT